MKLSANAKRILSVLLVFVLVFSVIPVTVLGTSDSAIVDTAVIFTDLHTNKSNYKESIINEIMSGVKNAGLPVSSVTSGGDAFSVNESSGKYTGYTSTITNAIQSVFGNVPVNYVWSDHDRYAVKADGSTLLDKSSHLVYGAGNDGVYGTADDGNYYVYMLSMGDMSTNDRYGAGFSSNRASNGFTDTVEHAIANFQADAAKLLKDRPLLIVSHQPLLDNRNDNGHAYNWCTAINEVAEEMDVAFFFGHNHKYDKSSDYYYAKGSTMSVCSDSSGNAKSVVLNFAHICGGYMEPTSSGSYSSSGTRRNVVMAVSIYEDAMRFTTYDKNGIYTGSFALDVTVPREFASVTTHTWEVTEEVAATCVNDGYTVSVCADCGETKTAVISATGHDYNEQIVNSCTGAVKVCTCVNCGDSYSELIPAETTYDKVSSFEEGESYVLVASNYALTYGSKAGKTAVTVADNAITSDVSDAMIWTYSNGKLSNNSSGTTYYINVTGTSSWSKTISFTTSGANISYSSNKLKIGSSYLYYSSNSGFSARSSGSTVSLYQVNEAIGGTGEHVYESVTVPATCTQEGSVTYTCAACGHSYSQTLEVLGHNYTSEIVGATCTEGGYTVYTCETCGDSYMGDEVAALGHNYEAVTQDATCEEAGSVTYTCRCGDSYVTEIAALGHNYENVVIDATCTENGYTTHTCSACGHSYTDSVTDALGHEYETVTVEATCEEAGYTTHTCAICGQKTVTDEIPAFGHHYEAEVNEATCETAGGTVYTCAVCGDSYVADEVAALGHNYASVTTAPTCEEAGYTTHTCQRCGDVYVDAQVAALGHEYETVTVEATCVGAGSVTKTCVTCGETSVEELAALGHNYENVVTAPTCMDGGYTTHTCSLCGHSYTDAATDALGHKYEAVTVNATCTTDGSVTYTCHCGETYTEVLAATGHNYAAVVTEATCETAGYTTHTCAACGHSYVTDEVAALGHNYNCVITEATCTTGGHTVNTCQRCGHSYISNEVAALGHDLVDLVTVPNCTVTGYTTHVCVRCDYSYVDSYVQALGHDYETVTTPATCTANGSKVSTCTVCSHTVTETIAATGHHYTSVESDGYMVYTCSGCGHSYSEKLDFTYSKVSTFTSGNRYVITLYSSKKYYALTHDNNKISVTQVTVSGNEITSAITEDMLWDYSDSKLSYTDGGKTYYLYAQSSGWWNSSTTLTLSTSNSSSVSISKNKLKIGSKYLRYSGNNVSLSSSSTTTYLFVEE